MQWYRQYAEFATDPKVQMMSEVMQRRLIMLFCLRCNGNETFHETEVAFQLRISMEEWKETKALFIEKGFIDKSNRILNWEKRQYISDSSTERVKRFRKRSETVSVTPPDTEQIQNRTEQNEKKPPIPPFEEFLAIWNLSLKGILPTCRGFNEKRKVALRARWPDELGKDLGIWRDFCERVAKSPFLIGDNDRQWKADIDWALQPSSITKTLEGKYDGNRGLDNTGNSSGLIANRRNNPALNGNLQGATGPSNGGRGTGSSIDKIADSYIALIQANRPAPDNHSGVTGGSGESDKNPQFLLENSAIIREKG